MSNAIGCVARVITHETVRILFWVAVMTLDTNKLKYHRVDVRVDDKNVLRGKRRRNLLYI